MTPNIVENLYEFYSDINTKYKQGLYLTIIDDLFNYHELQKIISNIYEDIFRSIFILKYKTPEKIKIYSYEDMYDFIKEITKVDINDLIIFFDEQTIVQYSCDILVLLNKIFNQWVNDVNGSFKKGTKINFEIEDKKFILYLKTKEII